MRTASLMDINDTGRPASSRIQSPQRVNPRLPPELCDMIIDNLCGDKHSLSACTLVSHSWKRSARHHLFESVLVARQDDRNAYKHFLDFLSSAPDIGPTIRVICVDGYNQDSLVHGDIDASFMSNILDQIPKLKALLLLNCGWTRTKANNMHLYTRPQRSIGDLYINSFRAAKGPPHSKLEILRHFSHIDNLYLTRVWLGHFDVDDATGDISSDEATHNHCPCEPPNVLVNTLTLSLADVCLNFLEYLRRQPFLSTLDSLTLRELWAASYLENHEDIHLVGDIIRDKMSSTLRTFEIDLPRHGPLDGPEVFTALCLDSCRSLTSISINLLLDGPEKAQEEMEEMGNAHTHTQADDDEADGIIVIDTTQPSDEDENNGAVEYATASLFPHVNPSPSLYSPAEWSVPSLLLSHLPPESSITSITLSIELTGPAHIVSEDLKNVPDWEGLENECLRFDGLKRVCVCRLEKLTGAEGDFGAEGDGIPVVRRWGAMDRLEICNRLSRLFGKKLLVFDM